MTSVARDSGVFFWLNLLIKNEFTYFFPFTGLLFYCHLVFSSDPALIMLRIKFIFEKFVFIGFIL